jgi:hypothetical protein
MRTIKKTIYEFSELSEKSKYNALNLLSDINTDNQWYDFYYDDINAIGMKCNGFDIYNNYCTLEFIDDSQITAEKIILNHGQKCQTYLIAIEHIKNVKKDKDLLEDEYEYSDEEEFNDMKFLEDLGKEYLSLLRLEYEYQTSDEAIISTIELNEYEFTEDGKLY